MAPSGEFMVTVKVLLFGSLGAATAGSSAALGAVDSVAPWLTTWVVLGLLGLRHASLIGRGGFVHAVAGTLGVAVVAFVAAHASDLGTTLPSPGWMLAIVSSHRLLTRFGTHASRSA